MFFNDPTAFEEFFSPVAGSVHVRPATGSVFNAEISLHKLDKAGLFSLHANSFKACKEPQNEFYGLTLPLNSPFTISDGQINKSYKSRVAHLLSPGNPLDLTSKKNCHFLVCAFFLSPLNKYQQKLMQTDLAELAPISPDVLLDTPNGSGLVGSVLKAWAQLNQQGHFLSENVLLALEDDLLASLILYANDQTEQKIRDNSSHLNYAEEYICANLKNPVTRDTLAEVSGKSIRSLSRGFQQRHGMGPMTFLRRRRLKAAYLELLGAEPGSTTVTQVAISYNFSHFGKFAIEYKAAFGESPSATLAKK
jgi:AraC-like DNA-binding protein